MILVAALALSVADPACAGGLVEVGDYALHTTVEGEGSVTVLFESGNGNDGTVWEDMARRLAARGVKTLRYDRAGLGQSEQRPGEGYDVRRESLALRGLMDACAVEGPVLMMAHSYGGMIASLTAAADDRIEALMLLDTNNPDTETAARTELLQSLYRPQYDAVREQDPALAKHIIPIMEAWGETAALVRETSIPDDVPVYQFVRGIPGSDQDDLEEWHRGQQAYANRGPYRWMVVAPGMGHRVAQERPDWVEASALQLIDWLEAKARD